MRSFLLRYGVLCILTIMTAGMLCFINLFEIRTKSKLQIFLSSESGQMVAYLPKAGASESVSLHVGDTLLTDLGTLGKVHLRVDAFRQEPAGTLLHISPADGDVSRGELLAGNTYVEGHFFSGSVKLRELIFKR